MQLFALPYILLAYIFETSYSKLVTWWAKDQVSTNQNARNSWGQIERRTKWHWTNIWLFDDEMSIYVGLLVNLILGFCYGNLSQGTCELELASTSILVLQVKSLTKFTRKFIVTLKRLLKKQFSEELQSFSILFKREYRLLGLLSTRSLPSVPASQPI